MVADLNLYKADSQTLAKYRKLPEDLKEAGETAENSDFIKAHIPAAMLDTYCNK